MRKFALVMLGGAFLAVLVSACGGSSSSGGTASIATETKTSAACGGEPVLGGNLIYARQVETVYLNPSEIKNGNGDIFADEMLYTGLVRLDPEGGTKIVPALAESWEVSPDGKTYTFKLRSGLKFSDGSPITAEDVVFSLERFGNPEVNTVFATFTAGWKNAEIVNKRTVRANLTEPIAAFLYNIAIVPGFVVPKAPLEKEGEAFWKHPIGSGPFRLKEFVNGSHITLEKNPYFWEKERPYLDSVRFNFATESNSRVLALKSGEAQMADGIPYTQIESLEGEPDLTVQKVEVPAWLGFSLNHKQPEFDDLNVRKAMQYAIDRELINEQILHGVGSIPNSIMPAGLKFNAPDTAVKPYEYDVEKAKEYMEKSKFPEGFSTTLSYPAGFEYFKQLTLLLQQELGEIGIQVKLVEEDAATVVSRFTNGEYDMTFPYPQLSADVPVPDEFASFYGEAGNGTHGFYSWWEDSKISAMVKKFTRNTNEKERAEEWPVLQQEFLNQTPVVNVINTPFINAHQNAVCGTAVNALGVDHLEWTWLASGSEG
jgi:peptide/nickel transport system substrate-binding protein